MRILKIQIEGFGKLRGYSLSLTEGLNAHCVENGCGKTTLIAFIKAMLYGLADSRSHDILLSERKHYRPWLGGAFGGSMTVLQGDRILRIHRRFGARPSEDTLAVYDEESGEQTEALGRCPGQTLLSLDAESFTLCAVFSERAYTAQLEGESVLSHLGDRTDTESADTALARLADEHRLYEKRGGRGLLAETESALAEANARQAALAREAAALPEKERAYKEAKAALAALTDKAPHVPARKKRTARHISLFASVLLASLSMIGSLFHILFLLGLFPAAAMLLHGIIGLFANKNLQKKGHSSKGRSETAGSASKEFEEKYRVCYDCERAYEAALAASEEALLLTQQIDALEKQWERQSTYLSLIKRTEEHLAAAAKEYSAKRSQRAHASFAEQLHALGLSDSDAYRLGERFRISFLEGDTYRGGESLSRGGKELVSFARALALLSSIPGAEGVPLLLDDPFIAYDDTRLSAALTRLSSLAADRQVLYLTCSHSRMP